jgi:hypothetical protein
MHFVCVKTTVILEIISILLQHTRQKAEKNGYNKRYRTYAAE